MAAVHLEYMVCRRLYHLLAFCQDHCLENVYELGDVGHLDSLAVLVEDVEVDACDQGIADSVLLIQEPGIRAGLDIVPCAPFVYHQADPAFGIVSVHYRGVLLDEFLHREGLGEGHVPLLVVELGRRTLGIPVVGERVVVEGQAVHVTEVLGEGSLLPEALV